MSNPKYLSEAVLSQHWIVLGKTGSGKSSALRTVVEHLLRQEKRVCVIDPKGDWWGLKVAADGKGPGLPVILFGDFKNESACDVPINDKSGSHVAELVATGNRPCVIGFRGWSTHRMQTFWIDFAATLFAKNAGELYVVGDEFHNFAPKGKVLSPQVGESLHWSNRLLSEGRGLGLVCLLASQRPQKVHNDTLTSCETLVAMRVIHKADRDAVKDWIDGAGDSELGRSLLDSLAAMPRGDAYIWSPEAGYGPERVTFPLFGTFDSFAPPQLQKRVTNKSWADVDLTAVKEKLAAVIQEAKDNDPKELRKQIAELRAELKRANPADGPTKTVEVSVLTADDRKKLEFAVRDMQAATKEQRERLSKVETRLEAVLAHLAPVRPNVVPKVTQTPPRPIPAKAAPVPSKPRPASVGDAEGLGKAAVRVLHALYWLKDEPVTTPPQVAFYAGYTVNGHFNNLMGQLRSGGQVAGWKITDEGITQAEASGVLPRPTGNELQGWMRGKLSAPEQKIFDVLISAAGGRVAVDDLAAAAGYTVNGHFNNCLGHLRSIEVAEGGQREGVKAHDVFFT